MSITTDLHTHAVEVDTKIAETYRALGLAEQAVEMAHLRIRRVAGQRQAYDRNRTWSGSLVEAQEIAQVIADRTPVTYVEIQAAEALTAAAEAEVAAAHAFVTYTEAEYEYDGWSRFFLVIGGHIHSSMACSTCYPTTEFGWLPNLSGLTETDAVEVYGSVLCSVCFPSAPVDQVGGKTDGLTLAERAERDGAKAQAKADRDAAKAAKALAEPVRVTMGSHTETVTTVAAAKREIKQAIDNRIRYGYTTYANAETEAGIETLAVALRVKGIDIDTMIAKWTRAAERAA